MRLILHDTPYSSILTTLILTTIESRVQSILSHGEPYDFVSGNFDSSGMADAGGLPRGPLKGA